MRKSDFGVHSRASNGDAISNFCILQKMSKNRQKTLAVPLVSAGKVTGSKKTKKRVFLLKFKEIIAQNLILLFIPEHQIELQSQNSEFCQK